MRRFHLLTVFILSQEQEEQHPELYSSSDRNPSPEQVFCLGLGSGVLGLYPRTTASVMTDLNEVHFTTGETVFHVRLVAGLGKGPGIGAFI
ncbi:Hypothetical protein PHPALM_559 [Phytophthora palmivora]|uniref:Uncharacterized protein n=1 Tax=Phytophthora palmivora TaxID=4796 RepID=A0A2P4YUH6_9STRA|nr:Hypothetical protein PHPALM_559 [Phytophthora palmivora]